MCKESSLKCLEPHFCQKSIYLTSTRRVTANMKIQYGSFRIGRHYVGTKHAHACIVYVIRNIWIWDEEEN